MDCPEAAPTGVEQEYGSLYAYRETARARTFATVAKIQARLVR